jgi:hypothetical protein
LADLMRGRTWATTGRMRWLERIKPVPVSVSVYEMSPFAETERVLQQEWRNQGTGKTEWEDVPVVGISDTQRR